MANEFFGLIGITFCGGVIGAAFGALPSFILFGLLVIIGSAISIATGNSDFLQVIAFGDVFGPHVAFAGGVAATAYAATKKLQVKSGKDIFIPLLFEKNPEPLLVGGIFGIFGYCVKYLCDTIFPEFLAIDTIAASIFISAVVVRIFFSKKKIVDKKAHLGKLTARDKWQGIWLPWESDWLSVVLLGAAFGLVAAKISIMTGSPYLAFGVAAFSLIFLEVGKPFPVTHHIVLPASIAAPMGSSLIYGVAFGVIGAAIGEVGARLFYNKGDTHIDPPAFSILVTSILLGLFHLIILTGL